LIYAKIELESVKRLGKMIPESSWTGDASARYWNEAWLDQLIEEAFRLMQEKNVSKTDTHN
jgi:endo-alpha-1,4-polygalactosaminidase (GH114 family)